MTEPVLLTRDDGGVRTLTLNRPQRRNAIDRSLLDAGQARELGLVTEIVAEDVLAGRVPPGAGRDA